MCHGSVAKCEVVGITYVDTSQHENFSSVLRFMNKD